MDAFTKLAFNVPLFVRLVAKFILKKIRWNLQNKKKLTNYTWTFPKSPSFPYRTLDEKKYRKRAGHYRAKTEKTYREGRKHRKL